MISGSRGPRIISTTDEVFQELASGKISGQKAFMRLDDLSRPRSTLRHVSQRPDQSSRKHNDGYQTRWLAQDGQGRCQTLKGSFPRLVIMSPISHCSLIPFSSARSCDNPTLSPIRETLYAALANVISHQPSLTANMFGGSSRTY
jgi:hypothetical protein